MTYYLTGFLGPEGEAGYEVSRWEEGPAAFCGRFVPQAGAGVVVSAGNGLIYLTDERQRTSETPEGGGRIYAMRLDPATGALTEVNHVCSRGPSPSCCCPDPTGRWLLVTNFGPAGGPDAPFAGWATVALFRLREDGGIGEAADVFTLPAGVRVGVSSPAHAHFVSKAPLGDFYLVCDMGGDTVYTLRLDTERGKLLPTPHACPAESGPRYAAFHPEKPLVFVNFEEAPWVRAYRYDEAGNLTQLDALRLLPEEATEREDKQSGFAIHPTGRWLYTALRGKNRLMVLAVGEDGSLSLTQDLPLRGVRPKDCAVSPDGRFISVACREKGGAEFFRVGEDGVVTPLPGGVPKDRLGFSTFIEV